jgi:hypothetical protein
MSNVSMSFSLFLKESLSKSPSANLDSNVANLASQLPEPRRRVKRKPTRKPRSEQDPSRLHLVHRKDHVSTNQR